MDRFTENQVQYLAFIYAYTTVNGGAPAELDMQRFFHVSAPLVHRMITELDTRGLITRKPGVARNVQVVTSPRELSGPDPADQPIRSLVGDH